MKSKTVASENNCRECVSCEVLFALAPESKMSWEDTANAMAKDSETWSDWDVTVSDGISDCVEFCS
jgi:hypothetical protein